MENSFHSVGKISGSYGKEGLVRYKMYESLGTIKDRDFLFILQQNIHVPYRVVKIDFDQAILKFDDIDNQAQAEQLVGKLLYIPLSPSENAENSRKHKWIGFNIFDKNTDHDIGKIDEVREMPAHDMAIIIVNGDEYMIPLADELIESIDENTKTLSMSLPHGILNL